MLKKIDLWIFIPSLFLSLLGLLIVYSLSIQIFNQQLIFLALGLFFSSLLLFFDARIFKAFALFFYVLILILLVLTFLLGDPARGSIRWLDLGFLRFQPSELIKPFLAISLAFFADKFDLRNLRSFLLYIFLFLIPFFLVFFQPDLGSALIFASLFAGIALTKGVNLKYCLGLIILAFIAIPLLVNLLKPYQQQRLYAFFNPQADPLGSSYNQIQSTIAIGSGKIWGKGLGRGIQAQLNFLPENQTDFIFAAFAEEFGFLGSTLLLVLYFLIFFRLLLHAKAAVSIFSRLLIIAVFSFLATQTVIHIGMNLALLPVTGVTLPFVSAGGSSLVSSWFSLGLVMAVSEKKKKQKLFEIK